MRIEIRSAARKDIPKLCDYFKYYGNAAYNKRRQVVFTTHNRTLIALDGVKMVGVVQWYPKEDPHFGTAELEEVHVREEYRRRGIASRLLARTIEDISGYFSKMGLTAKTAYLFVEPDNKGGIALYKKHGFRPATGVIDGFYCGNERQVLYLKRF